MKQMKIWMVALTLVTGLSFTSCVNSDNDYTYPAVVTLNDYFPMDTNLKGDDGITYVPTNPSIFKGTASDNSTVYPERAIIIYKLAENEIIEEGKTKYNVEIVDWSNVVVKPFNQDPDTLSNSYVINDLTIGAVNGYLNTSAHVYYNSTLAFEVYIDEEAIEENVEKNILPVVLQFTQGGSDNNYGNYNNSFYMSWNMPNYSTLYNYNYNLSDSITIQVRADKSGNSNALVKSVKYKY